MVDNEATTGPFVIRTGVPPLDALFRSSSRSASKNAPDGFSLDKIDEASSICIAGPDGTGKSVLAMHFGARYAADTHQHCNRLNTSEPRFFYVSSDLSFIKAESMWEGFALNKPNARLVPFRSDSHQRDWTGERTDVDYALPLIPHVPHELDALADYLRTTRGESQFAFVDLAANTAGDDWGFLQRLLAALPEPEPNAPRHMVIVDAMEGMEAFAGELDAFGEKTSRRGRVAKLLRLAAKKCHLVLVVEEPANSIPLAEQFVADVVVRLRAIDNQGYSRRTIEIEKARGQLHIRGRHPYVIRDGRGTTTGEQVNFDDPAVQDAEGQYQSYIDVCPSLHSITSAVMRSHGAGRESISELRAGFGIRELDEMLATEVDLATPPVGDGRDEQGLPCGTVTALIGDANTQKSFLGIAFLGHLFHDLAWRAATHDGPEPPPAAKAPAHEYYRRLLRKNDDNVLVWAKRVEALGRETGAAVLVTTKDENSRTLTDRFVVQVKEETTNRANGRESAESTRVLECWKDDAFIEAVRAYIQSRTICRRLEVHDTPSPVLFHNIRRSIEAAHQIVKTGYADVFSGWPVPEPNDRARRDGWRVRFVLDDFNAVMRTYGRIHDDPLFLPFLLLYLRREGLSSLIIETQSGMQGMPALAITPESESDLRALSDHRLYTWHVRDFFGDHRIAIAAIPPLVQRDLKSPVLVRELEWLQPNRGSRPCVNPRFELYAGLDTNKPTIVPLRVHLYAKTSAWETYIQHLDQIWKRVFDSPRVEDEAEKKTVVFAEKADNYGLMREACELHADTNLDYSLIIQIDEFWHHGDTFRPQDRYLSTVPETSIDSGAQTTTPRADLFDDAYALNRKGKDKPDRIPFAFDFGFLACRARAWDEATRDAKLPNEELHDARDAARGVWERIKNGGSYEWVELMKAASYVAKWDGAQQSRPIPAFDLAMVAPETFSCLVLEIWFSEIAQKDEEVGEEIAQLMKSRCWDRNRQPKWSLSTLVTTYRDELYKAWLLLVECLDLGSFATRKEGFGFEFGRKTDPNAVVTRHWYKSAAQLGPERGDSEVVRFCRLPGRFSVRGDWFLAAVRGSRSDRLVDRALDLLSSRRANVDRLNRGLALPTRKIEDSTKRKLSSRLHGWRRSMSEDPGASPNPGTLTYADVLSLGPTSSDKTFHWLWRGNLTNYNASAPIWERWLYRMLRRWKRTREYLGTKWISGFDLYEDRELRTKVSSYANFAAMCELLCGEIEETTGEV